MWESIPGIIIMFLLSMLTMVFCYENSVREIFFVSVAAYSTQIILYSVFILLQTFLNINDGIAFILLYVVLLAVAVYMVLHFMEKRIDETEHVTVHPGFLLLLLVTAGLIDTVFKFYMVDHMLGVETKEIFAAWKIFSMIACLLLLDGTVWYFEAQFHFCPEAASWKICSIRNSSNMSFPEKIWN